MKLKPSERNGLPKKRKAVFVKVSFGSFLSGKEQTIGEMTYFPDCFVYLFRAAAGFCIVTQP